MTRRRRSMSTGDQEGDGSGVGEHGTCPHKFERKGREWKWSPIRDIKVSCTTTYVRARDSPQRACQSVPQSTLRAHAQTAERRVRREQQCRLLSVA